MLIRSFRLPAMTELPSRRLPTMAEITKTPKLILTASEKDKIGPAPKLKKGRYVMQPQGSKTELATLVER